jgi:hypothetical protein
VPDQEIAVRTSTEVEAISIDNLVGQVQTIQKAMQAVMKVDEHYGVIPGTDKPTLYKPGAEKLCLLFRLGPGYDVKETFDHDHYSVSVTCTLNHIPTGNKVAEGMGYCTTMESKYRYRNAQRVCPVCGEAQIIKGKAEYGGGWLCWKKKGGCGATFLDGDDKIESQEAGKVENPDLADSYNTVLKMGCKRALVAAVLNGTAASDLFAQDMEDLPSVDIRQTADGDAIATLRATLTELAEYEPGLWDEDLVLRNARVRFSRNIARLEDLTPNEAMQIQVGANTWGAAHPAPPLEGEEVPDNFPDDIEFAPDLPKVND